MVPALVLTAGLATRLRPLSFVRAKAALPVAGTPLIHRILRSLSSAGVQDVVLNLHHLPHTLTSLLGDGSALGMRIRYSWEVPVLGSAGGPKRAIPLLANLESRIPNPESRIPNPESRIPTSALAGRWQLTGQSGRGNFAGYSTPTRLAISESANEVTIAGDTGTENQMVASTYRLDGSETVVPGPLGWDTRARASRKDGALVIAVTRTIDGPSEKLRFDISDVYRLDNNGVLTLERSQGSRTRKMTYARAAGQ